MPASFIRHLSNDKLLSLAHEKAIEKIVHIEILCLGR